MEQIPKIIHYCWFGGNPLNELALKCIESWKKYLPDYRIIEWNENNFDVHCCHYVEEAYMAKKWAFVSDYARFFALDKMGGVYFDTDIEVLKEFDSFLHDGAFFGFGRTSLTLPVFGAAKAHPLIKLILADYQTRHFILENGGYDTTTIERTAGKILCSHYGLQMNGDEQHLADKIVIYPKEYFSSTDWETGIITKNPKLQVIHYADGSWMNEEQQQEYSIKRRAISIFGVRLGSLLGKIVWTQKSVGTKELFMRGANKVKRKCIEMSMKTMRFIFSSNIKIVFENFAGRGYGDNPKYIAEELAKRGKGKYDLVWIVNSDMAYEFPTWIRTVVKGTLAEYFELATAAVWVDNNRKSRNLYKSKNQTYIQTWHGFYPLKKIEKDAEAILPVDYVQEAMHDAAMTDLMVSGCKTRTKLYRSSFWYSGEILECGTPRNDIFFDGIDHKEKVRIFYGIDAETKLLLYAPTFRDDHGISAYDIDFFRLAESLENKFGGKWCFLIRLHPAVRERSKELQLIDKCVDVSAYDDVQELFCAADILVTDYSDCMFEFSLTEKPVFLYASDIESYTKERNFYYDMHTLPFPIATDNEELNEIISRYCEENYKETTHKFLEAIGSFEQGTASKTVADYIEQKIRRN